MKAIPCVLLSLCVVSCVGSKEFTIHTHPEGAKISINGEPQPGETPMTVKISQDKDLGIVATKPGYELAAKTITTRSSWWLSLLWTKHDPRAQYIEEDEARLELRKIPSAADFRPSAIPPYTGGGGATAPASAVPTLRPMPKQLLESPVVS